MKSQFEFLHGEWPSVFESAERAEKLVASDPRTSCFYARRALDSPFTGSTRATAA
jgi:type I restriction enzyme R subunit